MLHEQQHPMMDEIKNRKKPARVMMERRTTTVTEMEEEKLEIADLSGLSLDSLPAPSLNLGIICKLDLSNNNLKILPENLTAKLLNVVVLDVHSNQLKTLPNSIGRLPKLKVLNVAGNLLGALPRTIGQCRSLEELNANFNKLRMLPESIGFDLTNLKRLSINSNKLVCLPRSVSHLSSLRILDARLNCLSSLPDELEHLINLEILNISQNFQFLEALPDSIGFLVSLVELDVSYNKITTLPDSVGGLKRLQKLCVEGNPLVSPPAEVVEQGLYAMKEYLNEKMNAGYRSLPKKKAWIGKFMRYGTFSGINTCATGIEREGLLMSDQFRYMDSIVTPRYTGMFSPRRLFASRNYFRI